MPRTLPLVAAIAALALAASPALADRKSDRGGKHRSAAAFCPPGLAKKDPACVPPGQARKANREWHDDGRRDGRYPRIGERIDDRYVRIDDPYRYGLNPDYYYYRALDRVVRVDPQTRQVLAIIGLVDALLN